MNISVLFLFAITIHNLEEAVWLTRQSQKLRKIKMNKQINQDQFLFALFVITSLAYLITTFYNFFPKNFFLTYIYFGFLGSMIVNIIFPHLLTTIIEKCYSPGLLTGISVIIPINFLIIKDGLNIELINLKVLLISTIGVGVVLLFIINLSFKLAKKIITF
ncbi:HXXEE domain-containing protein [Priestia endophytica]|uniref:HXXEE domain-containing protein n=1 Tax=Priestia endophytica TaxID=135735 RepID=A0AAX1Q4H7_9BACI|nr:HXXEE domain-containing protein [Priestia endophytica]RAS73614.1 HXXEE domain-containing protein [Priestia endophytica]RAS91238.1 HXXEE domain-containing protein [Priestia endophytica]